MNDKNTYDYLEYWEYMEIPMLREELVPYLAHKKQENILLMIIMALRKNTEQN